MNYNYYYAYEINNLCFAKYNTFFFLIKILLAWRDSTMGKTLAMHSVDPGSVPGTPFGPPNTKNDPYAQNQESS